MSNSFSLSSNFNLPVGIQSHDTDIGTVAQIIVTSPCLGKASRICCDLKAAFDYGAFPAMHAAMLREVSDANAEGQPLLCTFAYKPR